MGRASPCCTALYFRLASHHEHKSCIESDTRYSRYAFTLYHAKNTRRYKNKYKTIQEGVVLHGILAGFGNLDTDSDKTKISKPTQTYRTLPPVIGAKYGHDMGEIG